MVKSAARGYAPVVGNGVRKGFYLERPKRQRHASSQTNSSNGRRAESLDDLVGEAGEGLELNGKGLPGAFKQFMSYARSVPLLSKQQEQELLARVRADDKQAITAMMEANYRLVASLALRTYRWYNLMSWSNLEPMDLVQEGIIGLHTAILMYNPGEALARGREQPFAFSTYATFWIRQKMTRAIDITSRTIRLPSSIRQDIGQVRAAAVRLRQVGVPVPSVEEIAEAAVLSEARVDMLLKLRGSVESLDKSMSSEEDDYALLEVIPDTSQLGDVEGSATADVDRGAANVRACYDS